MSETIIAKRCSHCKQIKSLSEFYKNRTSKDGCQSYCKPCCNNTGCKYRGTKKGKAAIKRYNQSEKGKATAKRYTQSEEGKAADKRYYQSEKGKIAHEAGIKRYNIRHPEQKQAQVTVNDAIRKGQLPRLDTLQCSCGSQAKHYHHNKGYAPEHWLDVIPVCRKCHLKVG